MLTQPETKAISPKKINKHFHKKFERRFVLSTAARHSIRLAIIIIVKGFKKLSKKTVIRSSLLRKQTYDAMQPDHKIHKIITSLSASSSAAPIQKHGLSRRPRGRPLCLSTASPRGVSTTGSVEMVAESTWICCPGTWQQHIPYRWSVWAGS